MKKQLFALTLAGLILLPACVKEVESPSVTAVRNAKAAELQSIASLNNANAEAALTLSNAEAALRAAEAKAKEAEAQKLAAEAELLKVKAELEAVNVEIAKVKLEEEKVALEIKKAELETKLVQLENLKAQAELLQAQIAGQLERLAVELEEALLRAKVSLLNAKKAYNQAAADLDTDGLITLANTYFSACEALYTAQNLLALDKVTLTGLENDLVDLHQTKAEKIIDNKREIAKLNYSIEYLKSLSTATVEELLAMETEALSAKLDAALVAADAANALGEATTAWNDAYLEIAEFSPKTLADQSSLYIAEYWDENGVHSYGFYHEDEFVKLFTSEERKDDYIPVEGYIFTNTTVLASTVDKDGFNLLVEDEISKENDSHDSAVERCEGQIEMYQDWYARYTAALNSIEPVVNEYKAEIEAAIEAQEAADAAYKAAEKAYLDYLYANCAGAHVESQRALETFNAASSAWNATLIESMGYSSVDTYQGQIRALEETVADDQHNLAVAEEGVSEDDAAAVETAQSKLDAQKEIVAAKQAAYDEAYAAMRAAKLASIADPTPEKINAYNEANTALSEAEDALRTEKNKLPGLQNALQTATDTYQAELDAVDAAQNTLDQHLEDLNEVREKLEKKLAIDEELEAKALARDEAWEAYQAIQTQITDNSAERDALKAAQDEANNACSAANNNVWNALIKYNSVLTSPITDVYCSYDDLKDFIESASRLINYWKQELENENTRHAANLEKIEAWKEEVAALLAEDAAYSAAVENLNNVLMVAWKDAFAADAVAQNELAEAEVQYNAISAVLDSEITTEETIATYKAEIADLEAEIADYSAIDSKELMIERYKNRIAAHEAKIAVLEAKVAEAKKALDAATSAE